MKLKITPDRRFLQIESASQLEWDQINYSFTKKIDGWFIIKKKIPHWDCEVKFVDKLARIPLGLWGEIKKLADKYNFHLEIEGSDIFTNKDYNPKDFEEWTKVYFKNSSLYPRDYQIEAAKCVLKYRFCTEEISTSAGKTLIAFMLFRYLLDRNIIKKMLYVVPTINLVAQTEEKFYEYEDFCGNKPKWRSKCIFSGAKKNGNNTNIDFGTYQSLTKKELDYFKEFDAVCIDECHHASAPSIKSILIKCYKAEYRFGLSGTLPKEDSCDSFMVQSHLGPNVYELPSADLISSGMATPVYVTQIELDYLDLELKKKLYALRNVSADEKDGAKLLNLEKDTARESRKRFNYICQTLSKASKNSLVLFADIKNEYGRNIYNWLRENTNKTVYYIDGGTSAENREYYRKQMEENDNVFIVASIGTFSEGVDIDNVFTIYILESHKSEKIIAQALGRGMRLMEGKPRVNIIDFVDDYEYGTHKFQKVNYLKRHGFERKNIYIKRKFPFQSFKIKL